MKNTIAYTKELRNEVVMKLKLQGCKPDGFTTTMFDHALAILSEMYERDEEIGMDSAKSKAYCELAEYYKACGSWN